AQWNRASTQTPKRTSLVSGFRTTVNRWTWSGASRIPSGNATPKRNNNTGRTSAATIPPALNSSQRKGSADRRGRVDVVITSPPTRRPPIRRAMPRSALQAPREQERGVPNVGHNRTRRQIEPGHSVQQKENE